MTDKIEKIKPFYIWLFFLVIYVSFSTEVLWRPFIFAEDTIFLNNALTDGIKSLIYRHAGYLEVVSRLVANVSIMTGRVLNNYIAATFVMKIVAICFVTYYVLYFGLADFAWIVKGKFLRYVVCFVILVWFGNFFNCYYNITSIHWMGEFFVFLVGMNLLFNRKFPSIFCAIICVLTCLQSPEGCLLLIPMAIYVFVGIKERKIRISEIFIYLLVFIATIAQYYVLKISSYGSNMGLHGLLSAIPKSVISTISCSSYILGNEIMSYLGPITRLTFGVLIWLCLIFMYRKVNRRQGTFIVLYAGAFVFMHYMMIHVRPVNARYLNQDYWIYSCPAMVLAFTFYCIIANINSTLNNKTLKCTILVFATVFLLSQISHVGKIDGLGKHYKTYDYDMLGMSKIEDANKLVDFNSKHYQRIKLYASWVLFVPVRQGERMNPASAGS